MNFISIKNHELEIGKFWSIKHIGPPGTFNKAHRVHKAHRAPQNNDSHPCNRPLINHFDGIFIEKICQKLRRIILLHFGLITSRFASGRFRKPAISMISRFSDVPMTPKTNYLYLWRPQDTSDNSRTNPKAFSKNMISYLGFIM